MSKTIFKMEVKDFGPECNLYVNGKFVSSLSNVTKNKVCEIDEYELPLSFGKQNNVIIQIFREWKGDERLVYTRNYLATAGYNFIEITYSGIRKLKSSSTPAYKKEPVAVSES